MAARFSRGTEAVPTTALAPLTTPVISQRTVTRAKMTAKATLSGRRIDRAIPRLASPSGLITPASIDVPSTCIARSGSSMTGHVTSLSAAAITSSPPNEGSGSRTLETSAAASASKLAPIRYCSPCSRNLVSVPKRTSTTPS